MLQLTQHLSNQKYSPREADNLVKIHGRYCGPGWTHGRNLDAEFYDQYPEVTPIDRLDRACQAHDKDCSKGGCSKKGDSRLIRQALLVAGTTLNPQLRTTALLVAAGISAARPFRSR